MIKMYLKNCTGEKLEELKQHLLLNGYDVFIDDDLLSVSSDELSYVKTILSDREIEFSIQYQKVDEDRIIIKGQQTDEVAYEFGDIRQVITKGLYHEIECLGVKPVALIFSARRKLLKKYGTSAIDYLQVFTYGPLKFWAISNKEKGEEDIPDVHNVTWLLPSEY